MTFRGTSRRKHSKLWQYPTLTQAAESSTMTTGALPQYAKVKQDEMVKKPWNHHMQFDFIIINISY